MPDITFVLPHLLYWSIVVLAPLIILYLVYKNQNKHLRKKYDSNIAYFFWLTGGIMGLHRLYLKSFVSIFYISIFTFILFSNQAASSARVDESNHKYALIKAEFLYKRAVESDPIEKQVLLKNKIEHIKTAKVYSFNERKQWTQYSEYTFYLLLLLMAIDFVLIPGLIKRKNQHIKEEDIDETSCCETIEDDRGLSEVYSDKLQSPNFSNPIINKFVTFVDTTNHFIGHYIAVWTLIAVFVFYYEVVVRYVFNSPTNWAHESMFLVFGMQYLFAGGFALKEGAHVRVDVIYVRLSELNRARVDILTSVFFFIFAFSLMVTGYIFFADAFEINEVSFTEWGVSYWPTKFAIFGGAILLIFQGIANLLRDIQKVSNINKRPLHHYE